MTSTSGASLQYHVHIDKLHVLQSKNESQSSSFRVPRLYSSLASDQCCTCPVYPSKEETVEMSAFSPSSDPCSIHLHLEGILVQEFSFRNDTILGIKLLPLVAGQQPDSVIGNQEYNQVTGVILIVASLKQKLSIHSIILGKLEDSTAFMPIECNEFPSQRQQFDERRIRFLTATVVNDSHSARPILLVALSSSLEGKTAADQSIVIQRYNLPEHKCPHFQFAQESTVSNDTVTVTDTGRVNGMTFGAVSSLSDFISLAVMTATQLTLMQVSLTKDSLALRHLSKLLMNGCHPSHSLGAASMLVSLGCCNNDAVTESFAIVCRPKSHDLGYTASSMQKKNDDTLLDAFHQEALTNSSFFSPTLADRRMPSSSNSHVSSPLIQEVTSDSNNLIEQAVSETLQELQESQVGDAVDIQIEDEASTKVITPDKIVHEPLVEESESKVPAMDASETLLSPLMGLMLADGETSRGDNSELMTSLLHIQSKTPTSRKGSADETAHMILVRIEYVGEESQMKLSPVAMPFPQEMTSLEIMSLKPLITACPSEAVQSPGGARGKHLTFDDLMFSPSPGKLMSPAATVVGSTTTMEVPEMSIVCKSSDSQKFYCFVISSRDGKKLQVESEMHFELESVLSSKFLPSSVKSLTFKGLTLDDVTTKRIDGRIECYNRIRLVMSVKPDADDEEADPKPINLSLQEDGKVFILGLSCSFPLGVDQSVDCRVVSRTSDSAMESTLEAILQKLCTFEKEVYRRMDSMENAIRENTERLEEVEATIRGYDQASF